MTNNLDLDQMATGQENKEDTNNDGNGQIDAALTEILTSDYSSGNVTLTTLQYQRNIVFKTSGLTVARTLTLALVKRLVAIDNRDGTSILTVIQGVTSIVVEPGGTALIYTDGTADGLVVAGGDGTAIGTDPFEDFIFFPVEGHINPTAAGGSAVLATVAVAANQPDVTSLDFDQTTAQHAQLRHVFKDADLMGNVSFQFLWSHAAASSFGVAWNAKGVAVSNDGALGVAFGTTRKIVDAGGTTDDHYLTERTGFVQLSTPVDSDLTIFDLFRDPDDGADDLDVDARLQGVIMHFWRNNPLDPDWANVSLLAGFDGEDAATDQDDESDNGFTATYVNNAQVDTAQSKFSRGSLRVDGTDDVVTFPDDAAWQFGSGNFTIEGHYRWNSDSGVFHQLLGQWQGSSDQRSFAIFRDQSGGELELWLSTAGTDAIERITATWAPTLNQWYHVAVDFDGTTYRLYVDGVVLGESTTTVTLHNSTVALSIGGTPDEENDFDGWADEVRITKGVARYAGAFTPPKAPFPRA